MSLVTQVTNVVTAIATAIKGVRNSVGTLASLSTTAKSDLVSAINEVAGAVSGAGATIDDDNSSTLTVYSSSKTITVAAAAAAALINDTTPGTSHVYSSQKTVDAIAALKTELVNGASGALDTFGELATALAADESTAAALATAVGNRVRFDASQTLTSGQKTQAAANLGVYEIASIGDVTTDFAAAFATALT